MELTKTQLLQFEYMLREALPFPKKHINQYFDKETKDMYLGFMSCVEAIKHIEKYWEKHLQESGEKKTLEELQLNKAKAMAFSFDFIGCYRNVSGISIDELVKKKNRKYTTVDYLHLTKDGNVNYFKG